MTDQDDSHYKTYPQGFSKREVYLLKKQAFLLGRKRLDPTQEIDEANEADESKLEHHRQTSELVTASEISKEALHHQPGAESSARAAGGATASAVEAAGSAEDVGQQRVRRNSEESGRLRKTADADSAGGRAAAAEAIAAGGAPRHGRGKRSSVKQFFESFRPRARSENPSLRAVAPPQPRGSPSSPKQRSNSGGNTAQRSASSLPDSGSSASSGSAAAAAATGSPDPKKRPKSPVGSLVSRLRNLAADTGERRRRAGSGGTPPVQGLPHPSDIPLDASYLSHSLSLDRRSLLRKAISAEESLNPANSYPPNPESVQLRHKDLFENLSHTTDLDGQCCIKSPTAMAESRPRRMSGPTPSTVAASSSQTAASEQPPLAPLISDKGPQQPAQQHQQKQTRPVSCRVRSSNPSGGAAGVTAGQDVQVTENEKYIIFRSKCMSDSGAVDMEEVRQATLSEPGRVFATFAEKHRCYDLIPTSSKLLVFDHNLNVKKAFFALVYNGLRAAPVWDSAQQRFVGMLTITDFINILNHFYRSALVPMEELESHRISTWRAQLPDSLRPFLWISPEASLYDAVRLLLHARVHRLPVVEPRTGNALFILTHKRILKFIYLYMHQLPMPDWLDASLHQLGIGTYNGIRTISESTPLVKVLNLFVQHRVSALPVVGSDGRLTDIYSKFDVINLAATKTYNNLDVSVKEALGYRRDRFEGVTSCRPSDSLRCVLERLVTAEVHRLVIVDSDDRVIGVVSLSDILKAIVLDHEALAVAFAASASGSGAANAASGSEPMETG